MSELKSLSAGQLAPHDPIIRFIDARPFSRLSNVTDRMDELEAMAPFFLLMHSFPPHPPKSFNRDCSIYRGPMTSVMWNQKRVYATDVRCVSQHFLTMFDKIVARDPEAVVIVQGDHGSSFNSKLVTRPESWPEEAFEERFGILMAARVPPGCRDDLYSSLSPVNVFRLVLSCLSGQPPDLVPDASYSSAYEKSEHFGRLYKQRPMSPPRP
jgi:hypothetical protein